jgi:hypothetical protein
MADALEEGFIRVANPKGIEELAEVPAHGLFHHGFAE